MGTDLRDFLLPKLISGEVRVSDAGKIVQGVNMRADWYPGIQAFCSHWRHAPMLQQTLDTLEREFADDSDASIDAAKALVECACRLLVEELDDPAAPLKPAKIRDSARRAIWGSPHECSISGKSVIARSQPRSKSTTGLPMLSAYSATKPGPYRTARTDLSGSYRCIIAVPLCWPRMRSLLSFMRPISNGTRIRF